LQFGKCLLSWCSTAIAIVLALPHQAIGKTVPRVPPLPAATDRVSLRIGGLQRSFLLHVPPSYDPKKPMPLAIVLHGSGTTGRAMAEKTGFSLLADKEGFIVVYPNGIDRRWNDGRQAKKRGKTENVNDVKFIAGLIFYLQRYYNIDRQRIYIAGHSNGAMLAYRLAAELSQKIAAIASVAGSIPIAPKTKQPIAPLFGKQQPVSILEIHGTADPIVKWEGGTVDGKKGGKVVSVTDAIARWVKLNGCSANPEIQQLPDVDPNDGTRVKTQTYSECQRGTGVMLYAIEGGGHGWPGLIVNSKTKIDKNLSRDLNATQAIWDFFAQHPKQ
jgi:polyhydroxybutyrate depolymerase